MGSTTPNTGCEWHCSDKLILAEVLGEQPYFDGCWIGVAEVICELACSSFYIFIETFDGVPIPMCFMLESQAVTMASRLQPRNSVNEKDCVVN